MPAILTGRYPSTIPVGSANWPPNVLPENRLFAEIMKDLGYRTAALLSYHYFARSWGLDQGFDEQDGTLELLHRLAPRRHHAGHGQRDVAARIDPVGER